RVFAFFPEHKLQLLSSLHTSSWGKSTDDGDEDTGPQESHNHAAPETVVPFHKKAEQEAANQRANQAKDEVADQAVAAAFHHQARQPARDQAKDEPRYQPARMQIDRCKCRHWYLRVMVSRTVWFPDWAKRNWHRIFTVAKRAPKERGAELLCYRRRVRRAGSPRPGIVCATPIAPELLFPLLAKLALRPAAWSASRTALPRRRQAAEAVRPTPPPSRS